MRFTVYLERLLPENVRHLPPVEQVFSDGPHQVRRWMLLNAGAAATAQLRCLALASLGRWQMFRLAGRVMPNTIRGALRAHPCRAGRNAVPLQRPSAHGPIRGAAGSIVPASARG
jgi:hypothetical protein